MCTHLSVEEPIYPPVTREVQRGEIRVMQYAPDSFGFVEVDFNPRGQMTGICTDSNPTLFALRGETPLDLLSKAKELLTKPLTRSPLHWKQEEGTFCGVNQ